MESVSNKACRNRNGGASFCAKAKLAALFLHAVILSSVTVDANAADATSAEENSEYFFACSNTDGPREQLATIKTLIEEDPSLVHRSTKDGEHCLHLCAISGNAEIVKLLLEKGADPNIRSTWKEGLRMHPLSWSTYYGRFENIELLLKHGADVNADFDLGGTNKHGEEEKVTVLDVVEQILLGSPKEEKFLKTRDVLVKNGAKGYASLGQEL